MSPERELHPALTRLRRRLELCRAPLVRLWSWPHGGRRLLLSNLSHFHPERWQPLDAALPLAESVRRADPKVPHLWWPRVLRRHSVSDGDLAAAIEHLAAGQTLFVPSDRWPNTVVLPEEWVPPRDWRLTAGETTALLEDPFAAVSVAEWMEYTAGWWGPLRWLRDQGELTELTLASAGPGLAAWLEEHVVASMAPLHAELLDACRLTAVNDPAWWRRVWVEEPELLRGLEDVVQLQGWLGDGWPNLWQEVPWKLERSIDALGPPSTEARRGLLHRRLGLTAAALGEHAMAADHLQRSDRPKWAQRLVASPRTSRRPGGKPPAGTTTGSVDPSTTGQRVIEVRLLGLPSVVDHSVGAAPRDVPWTLRRGLMTLAYLLLMPGFRASRDELIAAVWEGMDERSISKNFHPTLSTLRRALAPRGSPSGGGRRGASLVHYRQGVYSLSPDVAWRLDVQRFEELWEQGRGLRGQGDTAALQGAADAWQQAWKLYRGPLLKDAEEQWVSARRGRLHGTYRRLLQQLAELLVGLQRHDQALDVYRTLLLEEPFEESVHLAVMEIYGLQGRRDLVRRQFVRLQELLRSELGVEPKASTQQRFHELMH